MHVTAAAERHRYCFTIIIKRTGTEETTKTEESVYFSASLKAKERKKIKFTAPFGLVKGPTRRFGRSGFKEMDETVKSATIEIFEKLRTLNSLTTERFRSRKSELG